MSKKTRNWIIAGGAAAVILIGTGGYKFMDNYLGNRVEIEQAIPASGAVADASADGEKTVVTAERLNGEWKITDASKVYFSVTTSRETVNFENAAVSGTWTIQLDQPEDMKAEGVLEMSDVNSGNGQRDEHIKTADFFDVAQYPQATFTAASFEGLPGEWEEGKVYDFKMAGTMNVKGIDKEVTFDGQALYQDNQVRLSGTTTVTFADFGLQNPHNVVLDTENDISVRLELVLEK
ncbi:YceI family protein [Paenibacillus macerans]|uniref:YceI-like domain protein n=1 Tax=Paenibacillus macerans TaxID=44252 RepID=A0A090ZID5_PAEMA|nr:YceI family protein [Paenibacillus macerans]KFN10158.1 yceI-like domain protein [Paenibacillus macerans]MBS5913181.1 YceI family protein [Paenibacillus macerans]MCY7562180.1 YceI family protein [Paenibacillus macerans]MEC0154279.1 YceI family protein [Paenibacillus macerans]UMV47245.1 YceI family protein [Paenibacillus macerans]